MTKKILVTGGAGFLGSHLCEKLLARGDEVLCVDNLFTGTKQNILHLLSNPRFEFMRHDVTFPLYVEVDEIKARIAESEDTEKPRINFVVGETVKINDGPFLNFNGMIEEIDPERGKLKVMVSIFGRNTPVELEYWQVEKA